MERKDGRHHYEKYVGSHWKDDEHLEAPGNIIMQRQIEARGGIYGVGYDDHTGDDLMIPVDMAPEIDQLPRGRSAEYLEYLRDEQAFEQSDLGNNTGKLELLENNS